MFIIKNESPHWTQDIYKNYRFKSIAKLNITAKYALSAISNTYLVPRICINRMYQRWFMEEKLNSCTRFQVKLMKPKIKHVRSLLYAGSNWINKQVTAGWQRNLDRKPEKYSQRKLEYLFWEMWKMNSFPLHIYIPKNKTLLEAKLE